MQSASERAEGQKIFPMMQTSWVSEQKAEAVSWDSSRTAPRLFDSLHVKALGPSGKENAVAFPPDLSVVDGSGRRVGDEPEAVPSALGCGRGYGNSDISDLKKVTCKLVHAVVDAQETLDKTAPLDVNRIDPSTHKSE